MLCFCLVTRPRHSRGIRLHTLAVRCDYNIGGPFDWPRQKPSHRENPCSYTPFPGPALALDALLRSWHGRLDTWLDFCLSRDSISRSIYFMYWKSILQPNLPRHSPPGVSKISLVLTIYIQYDVGSDKPIHKKTAGDRDQHRAIPVGRSLTIYLRF